MKKFLLGGVIVLLLLVMSLVRRGRYLEDQSVSASWETKNYVMYDSGKVDEALAQGKNVVLFFYADRCPTCRNLHKEIVDNPQRVPETLMIFRVNFDTEFELKKKYLVTIQHTLVSLDSNKEILEKNNRGNLDDLINLTK